MTKPPLKSVSTTKLKTVNNPAEVLDIDEEHGDEDETDTMDPSFTITKVNNGFILVCSTEEGETTHVAHTIDPIFKIIRKKI